VSLIHHQPGGLASSAVPRRAPAPATHTPLVPDPPAHLGVGRPAEGGAKIAQRAGQAQFPQASVGLQFAGAGHGILALIIEKPGPGLRGAERVTKETDHVYGKIVRKFLVRRIHAPPSAPMFSALRAVVHCVLRASRRHLQIYNL